MLAPGKESSLCKEYLICDNLQSAATRQLHKPFSQCTGSSLKQGFGDIIQEKSIHQNALVNFLCKLLVFEEYSNFPDYESYLFKVCTD